MFECHLIEIHQHIQNDIFQSLQRGDSKSRELVCNYLNFVMDTLTMSTVQLMLVNKQQKSSTQFLEQLIWLLLRCMQLTNEDVLKIQSQDINFLIEEIVLDKNTSSMRNTAMRTLKIIYRLFSQSIISPLLERMIQSFLVEIEEYKLGPPSDVRWKAQEACLYCISALSEEIIDYRNTVFDIESFINNVVLDFFSNSGTFRRDIYCYICSLFL